jgi:hypothetical protein
LGFPGPELLEQVVPPALLGGAGAEAMKDARRPDRVYEIAIHGRGRARPGTESLLVLDRVAEAPDVLPGCGVQAGHYLVVGRRARLRRDGRWRLFLHRVQPSQGHCNRGEPPLEGLSPDHPWPPLGQAVSSSSPDARPSRFLPRHWGQSAWPAPGASLQGTSSPASFSRRCGSRRWRSRSILVRGVTPPIARSKPGQLQRKVLAILPVPRLGPIRSGPPQDALVLGRCYPLPRSSFKPCSPLSSAAQSEGGDAGAPSGPTLACRDRTFTLPTEASRPVTAPMRSWPGSQPPTCSVVCCSLSFGRRQA